MVCANGKVNQPTYFKKGQGSAAADVEDDDEVGDGLTNKPTSASWQVVRVAVITICEALCCPVILESLSEKLRHHSLQLSYNGAARGQQVQARTENWKRLVWRDLSWYVWISLAMVSDRCWRLR